MIKIPYLYTTQQMEEIQHFISENFGEAGGYIAHEITSEYVHTDTMMIAPEGENRALVTFGMGARPMTAPTNFKRTELLLSASEKLEEISVDSFFLAGELVWTSKFPFREDTWLGPGHTINSSDRFKEKTGYDYFALFDTHVSAKLTGIDEKIHFLRLVPIYEEEREWCVENGTFPFLEKLYEEYGEDMFLADGKRDLFIPEINEDEFADYNLMALLGIDREGLWALCEYLDACSENGKEVTYEMIGKWLAENR